MNTLGKCQYEDLQQEMGLIVFGNKQIISIERNDWCSCNISQIELTLIKCLKSN